MNTIDRLVLLSLLATALAAQPVAQTVWHVGSGGDFADLPDAVSHAAPGDTLLLANEHFSATTIARGVTIVGRGATVGGLTIWRLPEDESVTILGLHLSSRLVIMSNQGKVHVDDCHVRTLSADYPVMIDESAHVTFTDCHAEHEDLGLYSLGHGCLSVRRSLVSIVSSTLDATSHSILTASRAGIEAEDAELRLTNCRIVGGDASLGAPETPSPAISAVGSRLQLCGDSRASLLGGLASSGARAADIVAGDCTLEIDSASPLRAASILSTRSILRFRPIPALVASGAAPGDDLRGEVLAGEGDLAGAFVSLPGDVVPSPPYGELWADLGTLIPLGSGIVSSRTWPFSVHLPRSLPPGQALLFQGLVLRAHGEMTLTQSVTVVVR